MRELRVIRLWRLFSVAVVSSMLVTSASADEKPTIVTVNYPLQYMTERLVGDSAEVLLPIPNGVDPSFWRPSISDISTIQNADLIILNGAGFATWVDRVSLPRSKIVNSSKGLEDRFIVTESITHSHGDGGEHSHEGLASYIWLDPTMAIVQAETIAGTVAARGLVGEAEVADRLRALRSELETLDADARETLRSLGDVTIIATHPRYQYLAARYDLNIIGLDWEAGEAPTMEQIEELSVLAADSGASVLLWEAEPPSNALEATTQLGFENTVFPPLAKRPVTTGFTANLRKSFSALGSVGDEVLTE